MTPATASLHYPSAGDIPFPVSHHCHPGAREPSYEAADGP
jgi:hypothetical protein